MKLLDFRNLTIDQTKELNKLANNNRLEFNNILSSISSIKGIPIELFFTSIMSREPEFSPLYERCCKLAFISDQINNEDITSIIIKDYPLYRLLKKFISKNNLIIEISNDQSIIEIITYYLSPIKNFIRSISFFLFMSLAKKKSQLNNIGSKEIILISTHILKSTSLEDLKNNYIDRNFPYLSNYIDDKDREKIVFIPQFPGGPRPYKKIFNTLRNMEQNFIIKADYLKLKDYFYAYAYPFKLKSFSIKEVNFLNFEISSIIFSELWNSFFDYKTIEALLNIRISHRLKERGIKVRILLDWYENQISSRGLIYGFKANYPESKIIGYQGIIDSASYRINLHPTYYEKERSLVPDVVAVIGENLIEEIKEFDDSIKVISSPTFRYNYLWKKERKINHKEFTILFTLPIFNDQSQNILNLLQQTIGSIREIKNCKVLIKPHPTKKLDGFQFNELNQDPIISIVDGDFYSYIESTDVLVSSASTTCMEAIALGVPVAVIGAKNHILQNPIPTNIPSNYWQLCYTKRELIKFIESIETNKKSGNVINSDDIKTNYFKMPTKENVKELLGLSV
jgi:hypothetical protein